MQTCSISTVLHMHAPLNQEKRPLGQTKVVLQSEFFLNVNFFDTLLRRNFLILRLTLGESISMSQFRTHLPENVSAPLNSVRASPCRTRLYEGYAEEIMHDV